MREGEMRGGREGGECERQNGASGKRETEEEMGIVGEAGSIRDGRSSRFLSREMSE